MAKDYLQQFVLVGGTALALQIGHRKSYDLDLFSNSDFDAEYLLNQLTEDFNVTKVIVKLKQTLIIEIDDVKVDLIRFKSPALYPIIETEGIRLTSVEDIAPMKLDALSARGLKRDFFDIFFLLQRFSMKELLDLYDKKYRHETIFHVIRSLTYFEDAEQNADPVILNAKTTWDQVKQKITAEVKKLR